MLALVHDSGVVRVPGACVFMASASHIPPILVHHLKHNGALRENVILLTVILEHDPKVAEDRRLEIADVGEGFRRLVVRYGYMEDPDIPAALALAVERYTLPFRPEEVTYYLGRETLLATNAGTMRRGQELFFSFLSRNALGATAYFCIPPEQVVELGMQLDL
jgi:KUP system potassium uptake protein